jgi:gamma-butyrobetaine dioxygenase
MTEAPAMIADWRRFSCPETIAAATIGAYTVSLRWSDGRISPFHFPWLRDNCPCSTCVHPLTREQMFEIADAPDDLAAVTASVTSSGDLSVVWADGHAGCYEAGWLRAHAYDDLSRAEREERARPVLWGAEQTDSLPTFRYAQLMAEDGPFHDWLVALRDTGLTLVRGVPIEPGTVRRLAERISFIRETNFGVLFDVASKPKPDSNAYTSINLPPHTDLPTRELQPGVQFLHCLVNETIGGDSIFVDGFAVASALRQEAPEAFALLSSLPLEFWNKDAHTDYRCRAPIIALDGRGTVIEVRFANFLRGPLDAPAERVPELYRAYRQFQRLGREPRFRVQRRLDAGDMWVFDNRRVLHARTEFDPNTGNRHLQGCYVDRDELLSRIRILERANLR